MHVNSYARMHTRASTRVSHARQRAPRSHGVVQARVHVKMRTRVLLYTCLRVAVHKCQRAHVTAQAHAHAKAQANTAAADSHVNTYTQNLHQHAHAITSRNMRRQPRLLDTRARSSIHVHAQAHTCTHTCRAARMHAPTLRTHASTQASTQRFVPTRRTRANPLT